MAFGENPGVHFEEQAGIPQALEPAALDVCAMVGTSPRGFTDRAVLLESEDEHVTNYGGIFGTEHGPIQVRGYFGMQGQKLLYSRIVGAGAMWGSYRVLDMDGFQTALAWAATLGAHGDNEGLTTRRAFSTITTALPRQIKAAQHTTLAFNAAGKTITRVANSFVTDGFAVGQQVYVSGTVSNNKVFTVKVVAALVLTVAEAVVDEAANASAVMDTVAVPVADVSVFEFGDTCRADDGTTKATIDIFDIDVANSRVSFAPIVPALTTTITLGATLSTAAKHLSQTSIDENAASTATNILLKSAQGVAKGSVLLFFGDNVYDAPKSVIVTGVNGLRANLDRAIGLNATRGARVCSVESVFNIFEKGKKAERERIFSMSETYPRYYAEKVYGGTAPISTTASKIGTSSVAATNLIDNATSLVVDSMADPSLIPGTIVKAVATGAASSATGVFLHIKKIDGPTKTIYFDSVGKLGTVSGGVYSAANVGTVGVDLYLCTVVVKPASANFSNFLVVDETGAKGEANSNNGYGEHRKIPEPLVSVALTGGLDGSPPATTAEVVGSATEGAETGCYLFPKHPEYPNIAEFAIPGLADTSSGNNARQVIDQAAQVFAEKYDIPFRSSVPSDLRTPSDAKSYRFTKSKIDSSFVTLTFPWAQVQDPTNPDNLVETPFDGFDMAGAATLRRKFGQHWPPANYRYVGVRGVTVAVDPPKHGELKKAGINVVLDMGTRGIRMRGARTLYTNLEDGTGKHFSNVRFWLQYFKRSVDNTLTDLPFRPANFKIFAEIEHPITEFLKVEHAKGALEPESPQDAYGVDVTTKTTTSADLRHGDVLGGVHVVPSGATERILLGITNHEGSVRTREL